MPAEDFVLIIPFVVGVVAGWFGKTWNNHPADPRAIPLAVLPDSELRDITLSRRAALDEAIVALRSARERIGAVQGSIDSATTGFVEPSHNRSYAERPESSRTLTRVRFDIEDAIEAISARVDLSTEVLEKLTRRYHV